jgi:hypothetical protein
MPARKKRASRHRPAAARIPRDTVAFNTDRGLSFGILFSNDERRRTLERYAMQWSYIVRNRARWLRTAPAQENLGTRALRELGELGIGTEVIEAIGEADVAEVAMPFSTESQGWAARIFPWEYVLSAATRTLRGDWSTLISRHLQRGAASPARTPASQVLIVTSCPGQLAGEYEFGSEIELVETNLRRDGDAVTFDHLATPTASELAERVQVLRPDIVHLTGIDAHQGAELLRAPADPERRDGIYLRDEAGRESVVGADALARLLTADGQHQPNLVVVNTHYSATRLAAMAAAQGAGTAIGFQDVIDDTLGLASVARASATTARERRGAVVRAFDRGGRRCAVQDPRQLAGRRPRARAHHRLRVDRRGGAARRAACRHRGAGAIELFNAAQRRQPVRDLSSDQDRAQLDSRRRRRGGAAGGRRQLRLPGDGRRRREPHLRRGPHPHPAHLGLREGDQGERAHDDVHPDRSGR